MAVISVIVPVYNVEPYLRRCVDSILRQTFRDFDLILVDDGSPDHCGEICDEYAEKDERIHVIHQKNRGLSAARNAGIDWANENSDSEWLMFVDSDDWIHSEMLAYMIGANLRMKTRISICSSFQPCNDQIPFPRTGQDILCRVKPEKYFVSFKSLANAAWGKLYHKSCFEKERFPEGRFHEDMFIMHRILFREQSVALTNCVFYAYYLNPKSITQRAWHPGRMDCIDGYLEQIDWFKAHGYQEAYRMCVMHCLSNCIRQLTHIYRMKNHAQWTNQKRRLWKEGFSLLGCCMKEKISIKPIIVDYWAWFTRKTGLAKKK